jgi:hypothetical protein
MHQSERHHFCYIGKGIVERLKQEFTIIDEWLPFEIHPDTPPEGVLWKDYFAGMDPEAFFRQLDERGRKMGVRFGPQPFMSNSRKAMQGGEFAKEHGKYDAYHEPVDTHYPQLSVEPVHFLSRLQGNEIQLSPQQQMIFSIGRRTHRISKLADIDDPIDPIKSRYAEQMCTELGATIENADDTVDSIIKRFI